MLVVFIGFCTVMLLYIAEAHYSCTASRDLTNFIFFTKPCKEIITLHGYNFVKTHFKSFLFSGKSWDLEGKKDAWAHGRQKSNHKGNTGRTASVSILSSQNDSMSAWWDKMCLRMCLCLLSFYFLHVLDLPWKDLFCKC